MPRKTISFELDFMIKDIISKFTVKQFDDVTFNITPLMNNVPYTTTNMTGVIYIGCDNDLFQQNADIVVSNNNINIKLNKTMLQNCGRAYAELELKDSNGTVTSSTFLFNIEKKIGEGSTIPGSIEGFVAKYERLISEFKSQVNLTINNCNTNVNSAIKQCNTNVDNKLNTVDSLINVKISDFEKRFNRLTASQQQDAEVIDARTDFRGEVFDSLKERIDYTDKILRDSTVSTVETESDFTTVEATSNGYFEDVKLEGKTLVNIHPKATPNFEVSDRDNPNYNVTKKEGYIKVTGSDLEATNYRYVSMGRINFEMFKPNTTYTIVFTKFRGSSKITIQNGNSQHPIVKGGAIMAQDNKLLYTFITTETLVKSEQILYLWIDAKSTTVDVEAENPMIFEGDLTANPPSGYIEGLKSVGQSATTSEDGVDEIVVSSVNENLHGTLYANNSYIAYNSPDMSFISNPDYDEYFIPVEPNASYTIHYNESTNTPHQISNFVFADCNKNKIKGIASATTVTTPSNAKYMFYAVNHSCTNVKIEKGNIVTDYTPHQSDKKRLLFYNEETQSWEKPILRQWDSIGKHADGKYYYHQRSAEVVLNGSEDWAQYKSPNSKNVYGYYARLNCKVGVSYNIVVCDKLTSIYPDAFPGNVSENAYVGCIYVGGSDIGYVKIATDITTLAGFKQWLQANNLTVVYQLAQEKVYECTNIDLITYANETNYVIESGAISPKSVLKVHNNISNVVSLLQKKVSVLESNMTKYMITQNRLMLASRYNADTVGFKVDVASYNNSFEYDNDLYELILNNILVGKDNYDREYIENLIIFYWMDFVISDEMHSTLFEIIEEQHNPKIVEEAPIE